MQRVQFHKDFNVCIHTKMWRIFQYCKKLRPFLPTSKSLLGVSAFLPLWLASQMFHRKVQFVHADGISTKILELSYEMENSFWWYQTHAIVHLNQVALQTNQVVDHDDGDRVNDNFLNLKLAFYRQEQNCKSQEYQRKDWAPWNSGKLNG